MLNSKEIVKETRRKLEGFVTMVNHLFVNDPFFTINNWKTFIYDFLPILKRRQDLVLLYLFVKLIFDLLGGPVNCIKY